MGLPSMTGQMIALVARRTEYRAAHTERAEDAPLHEGVEINPNSIVYLGHIDATIVERKDGELRAGPVIPLVDQAVAGFSGGTWDISVTDQFDDDVTAFKKDFPALTNASIDREVLPAWDKQKATEWWNNH